MITISAQSFRPSIQSNKPSVKTPHALFDSVCCRCVCSDQQQIAFDIDLMEQVHIGHYILGRTIGNGGFAKVKQARHDLTGIRVAIKILNKRKMRNKNMISKVKREIKILRFINHANIIKLYEVLDTTNDIFVIMELAEKGELFDYIQTHQISEDEAKFFFRQIINGIGYAHANLISHRDLKPQNILVDSNKIIKIVDFGLSNLMKDGRLLKTACGSPNYAAPEIVGERKYEGTSVDVWSCGVILYALLVGRLPFYEETVTLLYRKIQTGNYTIPNSINPMAGDLIRRMLQVDPFQRIRIHEIKNHPWIRPYVPIYCRIPLIYQVEKIKSSQINKEIFQQIKGFTYAKPITKPDHKIRKSIKKKDDDSFVVAYQLLKDKKQQQQKANSFIKSMTGSSQQGSNIVSLIENIVVQKHKHYSDFQYGKRYLKRIRPLLHSILLSLKALAIQYSVKNQQYCLKCVFFPQYADSLAKRQKERSKSSPHLAQDIEDESQKVDKSEKFSKTEIRFNLQIYTMDLGGIEHMVDLQITQGHPLLFFNIASKLYKMIEQQDYY